MPPFYGGYDGLIQYGRIFHMGNGFSHARSACLLALLVQAGVSVFAQEFRLSGAAVVCPDAWQKAPRSGWGWRTAQDLTNALFKVTGKASPLVLESKSCSLQGSIIYLGDVRAARDAGIEVESIPIDSALIRVEDFRVFISGQGEMGPSNGIIEFLQRHADWYFVTIDGCDRGPVNPHASAPVGEYWFRPAFDSRRISLTPYFTERWKTTCSELLQKDFARRLRIPLPLKGKGVELARKNIVAVGPTGHSYYFYLWPAEYFERHPEYYSLGPDGKRHCQRQVEGQLCLSNPQLLDEITTNLLKRIKEDRIRHPGDDHPVIYDFSQNDCASYLCECPDCKRIIAKYNRVPGGHAEGGDAGLQLEFVNELARRARALYPDVIIRTFAYTITEEPPVGIVPESNVMIWLCDLYSQSCHLLPLEHPFNARRLDLFKRWRAISKQMEIWDYWLYHGGGCSRPEVHARALASDIRLFADNGLKRFYAETHFDNQCFYELNSFLAGQLMCHPHDDVDRLISVYCRVYGPAAQDMENAIRLLCDLQERNPPASPAAWHARVLPYCTVENWTKFRDICLRAFVKADTLQAKGRIGAVLKSVTGELLRFAKGTPEYTRIRADFMRYANAELQAAPLADVDKKTARDDVRNALETLELSFDDLPDELKEVPSNEILLFDHHKQYRRGNWEVIKSDKFPTGQAYRRKADPKKGATPPYACVMRGISDNPEDGSFTFDPPADGEWHWYRLGEAYLGRGARFFVDPIGICYLSFELQDCFITCDGAEFDPNYYEVWLSARYAGAPAEDSDSGLFVDRLVLRRINGRKAPGCK